jgi:hypothetical protein
MQKFNRYQLFIALIKDAIFVLLGKQQNTYNSDEYFIKLHNMRRDQKHITCFQCKDNKTCEWAYDHYNTDGDCLAIK